MSPLEAAEKFAEFVNDLESQGFQVDLGTSQVLIENVPVRVGSREGDPWVVDKEQTNG